MKLPTTLVAIVAASVLHNLAIELKDPCDVFPEVDINIINSPPLSDEDIQINRSNAIVRDTLIRDVFAQIQN